MLERGIPWEVIEEMSDKDIAFVIGVDSAIKTKQQEDQDQQSKIMNAGMRSKMGGM